MPDRLNFGIYLPQVAFGFDDLLERAQTCERLGIDSLWLFDHLWGPGLRDVPSFEGWTLATALLARTERLRIGHLVTCNNFRHPALLAKMATSADVISGGRVEFGIGSGSVEEEHIAAGLPWESLAARSERLAEGLEVITRMFTGEPATYEGKHYTVRDVPNVPPPVQSPRPPIHVGGAGVRFTLPIVARYADVWNVPTYALDRLGELTAALDRECERIGRDPAEIRRSLEAVLVLATEADLTAAEETARRRFGSPGFGLDAGGFIGTADQIAERVGELADQGFSYFVFFTHDRGRPETLELLAEEVMSRFDR